MKKKLTGMFVISAMTTISMTFAAYAGEWKQDSKGYWWVNDDGSYPVSTWQWIDDNKDGIAECYYFDETGYMWTNDKPTPDGYQVDQNGAWTVNGVLQTKQVTSTRAQTIDDSLILGEYYIYNMYLDQYQDWAILHCEKNEDGTYHIYTTFPEDGSTGIDFICYAKRVDDYEPGIAFYPVGTEDEELRFIDRLQEFAYYGPWEVEYFGKTLSQ